MENKDIKTLDKAKTIVNLFGLLIMLPISLSATYLLYKHVEAPDIVWVLWIIYLPVSIIVQVINSVIIKTK